MNRNLLMIVLCIGISFPALAKKTIHSVSGTVKDEKGAALFAANVYLLKSSDSSFIAADYADLTGRFSIELPDTGTYIIRYEMVGYGTEYSGEYSFKQAASTQVPSIVMHPVSSQLKEVTVSAKKPFIEVKPGKTILNVESSINATGSDAMELLKKSPGVTVDNNDNINLRGKSGAKIYIDGRPSSLDGKDLANYLRSISSSDIETIELITIPGARYDAAGNTGIINIKLKKNKKFGVNGNATAGLVEATAPKGNGAINLNYRNQKINAFGNVSANNGKRYSILDFDRTQLDTFYRQKTTQITDARSVNVKTGLDYFINAKNTVGIMETLNVGDDVWRSNSRTAIMFNDALIKNLQAFNTITESNTNSDLNLNYKYADTNGTSLNIDADYGLFRGRGASYQPNYYTDISNNPLFTALYRTNQPTDIDFYTFKADYERKLGKDVFDAGCKYSTVSTWNDFKFFNVFSNNITVEDLTRSNNFKYVEQVAAGYLNYSTQFGKNVNVVAGVRVENTSSTGVLTRADGIKQHDDSVTRQYTDIFPNIALSWTVNTKNSLSLTYSRRLDRPSYQDLNPFVNKLDELTYQKGNAFLQPQYSNNAELTHTFKNAVNTTLFYSMTDNYATQVADTIGNASYIQQRNIGTMQTYGLAIGTPIPITKWWSCYVNLSVNGITNKGSIGGAQLDKSIFSFNGFMQNDISLPKNMKLEGTASFGGPYIWGGSWLVKPLGGLDLGFQKQCFNSKATVKLSVTDIFYTNSWYAHSNFGGMIISAHGIDDTRTLRLSFSYRFGSAQIVKARERKAGSDTESNRIKSR